MKKIFAVLLTIVMIASLLTACGGTTADNKTEAESTGSDTPSTGSIKIVTTIFPLYDWVREVARDDVDIDIDLLLDNGVDLHSYQPTAKDIMDISDCDIFLYVGGESDEWVDETLVQADNKDMIVLDLIDVLGNKAKEEEIKEGMQGEEEDEDEDEDKESEEEDPEYDEHVWLSLKNAALFTQSIADALKKVDSQHADAFQTNADSYIEQLGALDTQYQETVDNAAVKTLLFGDRFPFRYLTDDYGLDYYAAFVGCSAETEASFETILFLANKVDELGLKNIMQIESADGSIANTIKENTKSKDQQILTLNSIQSVTSDRIEAGETYLSIMQSNLEVLKQALT